MTLRLGDVARSGGFDLIHRAAVGSTNADAMALMGRDRVWVVADEQTAGRGRRGREWTSPRGNLYASLRLIAPAEPRVLSQLCFVAALALADGTDRVAPKSAASLTLKWPNDVLIDGAKVAGILIEGVHGPAEVAVVIGCGVNVVSHPENTPYPATALALRDPSVDAAALFIGLSDAFAERLAQWQRGGGFSDLRAAWLARAAGLGSPIVVRLPAGDLAGRFEALDEDGQLILSDGASRRAISAGEVFFPALSRTTGAA